MDFNRTLNLRCRIVAVVFAVAMLLGLSVLAGPTTATAARASAAKPGLLKGNPSNKRLATEFLRLLKNKDQAGLRRFLDHDFLLQRTDEYLTKKEYLANPSVVEAFKVRRIVGIRKAKNVRVVRFEASTSQTINGKPVAGGWLNRLSTFVKTKGAWRLVAHANFAAPAPPV